MNANQWIRERISNGTLELDDLITLVPFAQRELGVDDDGKPGRATLAARNLAANLEAGTTASRVQIPKGRAAMLKAYGDPKWTKLPRGRAVDMDDRWEHENIRSFRLHTGRRVRLHRLAGAEFVRLFEAACNASGYTPRSVQTYVPRVIGGTDRLSTHALGIGVDFDPSVNPWGAKAKLGAESPLVAHPEFLAVFRSGGWTVGADWRNGDGDWMHIQRAGT